MPERVIQPGDIVYSIGDDPFEFFYVQPLIVKEVLPDSFTVEAEEDDVFEITRENFLLEEKDAYDILVKMLKDAYYEKKTAADEVKEQLKTAKDYLKSLK